MRFEECNVVCPIYDMARHVLIIVTVVVGTPVAMRTTPITTKIGVMMRCGKISKGIINSGGCDSRGDDSRGKLPSMD